MNPLAVDSGRRLVSPGHDCKVRALSFCR